MTIIAGDIIRCVVKYNLSDLQVNTNVNYYLASAGVAETDSNVSTALATQMITAYTNLIASLEVGVEPGDMILSKFDPVTSKFEQFATVPLSEPDGTGIGDFTPNIVSAVVRFFTDGLGQQGRKFLSGFLEGLIIGNDIGAALVTALANWALDYHDAVAVAGGTLIPGWFDRALEVHRAYNLVLEVNTIAGSQIRRKPGRGD